MTDLGTAADELYGLPARDFTAARDRRAADIRQTGDRELAAAVKKLRRPTATAWYANQLVRRHGDQVAELLDTGAALRRAQAELDVDGLRHRTQEGQRLVTELTRQARRLADDAGESLSDQMVRELEETLHAGLVDPAASDAIRSGHLTGALHYSGFGLLDVPASDVPATAAPAGPAAARSAGGASPKQKAPRPGAGPDIEAARQAQQAAERDLQAARREAGEAGRRFEQARKRQEVLRQRIHRLDEELERLRTEEAEASDAVAAASRDRRGADDRVAHAEARLKPLPPQA